MATNWCLLLCVGEKEADVCDRRRHSVVNRQLTASGDSDRRPNQVTGIDEFRSVARTAGQQRQIDGQYR